MRKIKKPLILLFIVANLYAIGCGGLYFFQENLIFHPSRLVQDYEFEFENTFEEVYLDIEDGQRLHGIHFPVENAKGAMLYYHGNAGDVQRWGEITTYFVEKGYSVIVMDYRQYGKSGGTLSEEALYEDSLKWYAFAKAQYSTTPLHIYGRSLGTTFATYVASKNPAEQLILETPFYSIQDEAKSRFPFLPLKHLLKYKFPTYSFINDVQMPISIIHGTDDGVVDYDHGKRLFDHISKSDKDLTTVPEGGHNNLIQFPEYLEVMETLLP
ncbi:alpha/beta fold hydrolase [Dokdonia sinensis]|uniref:Alpha/beta fold hydrolase n=1 Tax=Dokdonia sinensis TaxID=2479847 RepID=A0A3M0GH92_9FLAO|nr:alpha/beta fold hydrolase [Dokdonia sinensis]RMB60953.1 alpha/beta fold hydrolase [Dokdonia sinensis]